MTLTLDAAAMLMAAVGGVVGWLLCERQALLGRLHGPAYGSAPGPAPAPADRAVNLRVQVPVTTQVAAGLGEDCWSDDSDYSGLLRATCENCAHRFQLPIEDAERMDRRGEKPECPKCHEQDVTIEPAR